MSLPQPLILTAYSNFLAKAPKNGPIEGTSFEVTDYELQFKRVINKHRPDEFITHNKVRLKLTNRGLISRIIEEIPPMSLMGFTCVIDEHMGAPYQEPCLFIDLEYYSYVAEGERAADKINLINPKEDG